MRLFLFLLLVITVYGQPAELKKCNDDEELKKCGAACEATCEDRSPVCTEQCLVDVCQCPDGFVRHDGKCIFPAYCPKTCSENEEVTMCGTACEPSCADPNPESCTKQCLINVCQCKEDFVRNLGGACVRQNECPQPEVIEGETE